MHAKEQELHGIRRPSGRSTEVPHFSDRRKPGGMRSLPSCADFLAWQDVRRFARRSPLARTVWVGRTCGPPVSRAAVHVTTAAPALAAWATGRGANPPRCSSSRAPCRRARSRSYFAVLIVCSPPRVVSTVSRSRSPVEAMNPITLSSSARELDEDDPLARTGEIVDLLHRAEQPARVGRRRDHGLLPGHPVDANDFRAVRRPWHSAGRLAC